MKTFLMEKGYTVTAVSNADEYTYEETEIKIKASKEAYISLIKEDISGEYIVGTASATLEEGSAYDAQVIVGKE